MNKISWTEQTWNPVTGCTKISPGCLNCYAERMANRLRGRSGYPADKPFGVTLHDDRLYEPMQWRKPRMIFVCSMGDLFHKDVPFEFVDKVMEVVASCGQHTFQILTKRPARMAEYFEQVQANGPCKTTGRVFRREWPLDNLWLGVTAENQEMADQRISILLETPAAIRFVSVEPMIGSVDLERSDAFRSGNGTRGLDWVICGGETGPGARPMNPTWAKWLKDQCAKAGIPFHFKSWGDWAPDCLCQKREPCREIERPQPGSRGVMFRCGKNGSERLIDGKEFLAFPEAKR